ncbi:MAG: serine/threonine-protein kinase [Terriglobia bacterium]|jgi:serine/threonine-protein kinase
MKKIGRYDVIGELGRGAMGIVYKAADPTIGRQVALKVLSFDSSADEGTHSPQEMFMREVRAAGRLAHPSIVTIHDAFEDAETKSSCIVMELVPGKTLESILLSGHVKTVEQTLDLVRQVAEGLDYAHRNQVVHRDLKPANILVTEDGRIKITDFGIAKVLAREGVVRTVGVMGTPSYMSPEQVKGGEIDARADLFSLGIILFLMLTGQKPFMGDTAAVMFKIVYENPALPSSVDPLLTPAHDYVVLKCLAKDRDKRYSSARELLNDLDDLQHGRQPRSQAAAVPAPAPASQTPTAPPTVDQTLATTVPILAAMAPLKPSQPVSPARQVPPPPRLAMQPPQPVVPRPVQEVEAEVPVAPKAESNAFPIILGVVAVVLVTAAALGYWKYHQIMSTVVPPPHIALLPPPPAPPGLMPVEPVSPPAEPEEKPVVNKPKQAAKPRPKPPAPAPAPPQPALIAEPPPKPVTPTPSVEATAKAEAAKLVNVPRVVQLHCKHDLKEATFTVASGGQTLFQGSLKGKKKGGFLAIKGAYEGTFSRTITVPAGASDVSIHIVTKDGATDLSKAIQMLPPGGFIPTLDVEVESDHLTLNWGNSSKPKP